MHFITLPVLVIALFLATAAAHAQSAFDPSGQSTIAEVQRALNGRGFDVGEADGVIGRRTTAAIQAFQESAGLPASGVIDRDLGKALGLIGLSTEFAEAMGSGEFALVQSVAERIATDGTTEDKATAVRTLRDAVKKEFDPMVRLLARAGIAELADRHSTLGPSEPPLLHLALENGSEEILTLLASLTDDLERLNSDDMTALVRATHDGKFRLARILVEAGADVNSNAFRGVTPLHFAANSARPEFVDLLLQKGADPEARESIRNNRPLEIAMLNGRWDNALTLTNAGSKIDPSNKSFQGGIEISGQFGESQLIERADALLVSEFTTTPTTMIRTEVLLRAPEGEFYDVIVPKPGGATNDTDLILGPPGTFLDAEGSISGIGPDGLVTEYAFSALIVGDAGRLKGSYVLGYETGGEAVENDEGRSVPEQFREYGSLYRVTNTLAIERIETGAQEIFERLIAAARVPQTAVVTVDDFAPFIVAQRIIKPSDELIAFVTSSLPRIAADAAKFEHGFDSPLMMDISFCFGGWDNTSRAPVENATSDFIWNHLYHERVFTELGIPEDVWREKLDRATSVSLAMSHGAFSMRSRQSLTGEEIVGVEAMVGQGIWLLVEDLAMDIREYNRTTYGEPGTVPAIVRCI